MLFCFKYFPHINIRSYYTKVMKLLSFIVLIFSCITAFSQQKTALHYKIYNTTSRKMVTADDVVNDMAGADVLFLAKNIPILLRIAWS